MSSGNLNATPLVTKQGSNLTMVPWYHGTMVPWYHGTMVPWYQVSVGKIGFGRVNSANDYIYDIAKTSTFAMQQKFM